MRFTVLWAGCSVVIAMAACSREPASETTLSTTSVVLRLDPRTIVEHDQPRTLAHPKSIVPPATKEERAQALAQVLHRLENTEDPNQLIELVGQLGTLDDGSPRVLALCARLLNHADARVRAAVLEELWFFDDISPLTTNIINHLRDPDCTVRGLAVERLGEIETPLAIETLIQNLTNDFPDVREACEEALVLAVRERFDTPEQAYRWWEAHRDTWFAEEE